jgi:hypothetical protein
VTAKRGDKLNEDQLAAIKKKGEVVSLIEELEEVSRQITEKYVEVCNCFVASLLIVLY